MSKIQARVSEEERELIDEYAKAYGITVSELLRRSVLDKIEDELDIKTYYEARQAYLDNPIEYSVDDMEEALNKMK